eukprot:2216698-Rhodomonas_salina.4
MPLRPPLGHTAITLCLREVTCRTDAPYGDSRRSIRSSGQGVAAHSQTRIAPRIYCPTLSLRAARCSHTPCHYQVGRAVRVWGAVWGGGGSRRDELLPKLRVPPPLPPNYPACPR